MKRRFYLCEKAQDILFIICESDDLDYLYNLKYAFFKKNKITYILERLQ